MGEQGYQVSCSWPWGREKLLWSNRSCQGQSSCLNGFWKKELEPEPQVSGPEGKRQAGTKEERERGKENCQLSSAWEMPGALCVSVNSVSSDSHPSSRYSYNPFFTNGTTEVHQRKGTHPGHIAERWEDATETQVCPLSPQSHMDKDVLNILPPAVRGNAQLTTERLE